MRFDKRKNIFACLFSIHNTISLSRHEQVCFSKQIFPLNMHISFKYARNNHLRCPMMGEVSLET